MVFIGDSNKKIDFSLKNVFWSNKPRTKSFFTKASLKRTVHFIIENSYFIVGNVLLLQTVGILMGTDPAPFWSNLYLYNYISKYTANLTRTNNLIGRQFHSTFRFIDYLCALNTGGEFGQIFLEVYSV